MEGEFNLLYDKDTEISSKSEKKNTHFIAFYPVKLTLLQCLVLMVTRERQMHPNMPCMSLFFVNRKLHHFWL